MEKTSFVSLIMHTELNMKISQILLACVKTLCKARKNT